MKLRIAALSIAVAACAFGAKPTATDIMKKVDYLSEQTGDVSARVTILQQKTGQGIKQLEMRYFRRDKTDSFMMIIDKPDADKGNGYLKVGDDMWMYRKNTRTFTHINRDETIEGSDAKAGDFEERKLVDQYKPLKDAKGIEIVEETTLGKNSLPVYKITLIAFKNDVTYPKQEMWVDRDLLLPRQVKAYSLSGTLMSTVIYREYTIIDGKYVPVKTTFIDEFEKGNLSGMQITDIKTDPISETIFTKAYLENLSK
ncbi:MAG: outer membrane lipoprotein-sorting protein [Spirochaetes bacterium]|nr:outer membrane lipoprotein-sorting protein [Spirochaetota bacterium]